MKLAQDSVWPSYSEDEIRAVSDVLRSGEVNYWTGGEGRAFEREFSEFCGTTYGVAVTNGTVALDLALNALGIGKGDEVIVTPRTFLASASSIVLQGARPIFADVDKDSQNITPDTIKAVLTPNTRAIVAVHLAGWPCEMDEIMDLAEKHGLYVIEDCAQAHGATYKGRSVGSIGHIGAWSFCQDKIITTGGEGGMVTTNNHELWSRMWSYKDHGKSWAAVYEREHSPGFRWYHESFGTNGRLTEMQSAIGRVQLKRLTEWRNHRLRNAQILNKYLAEIPGLRTTIPPEYITHAYYKYYVFVQPAYLKKDWNRNRIMNEMVKKGVPCFSGTCPEVYLEKAFRDAGLAPQQRLPEARELGESSLMLLVHPTLGEHHMEKTAETLIDVMLQATR